MYQFFGQDEDDKLRRRTLTEVLVGPLLLSGKGTATELSYDSANNLLHIRIRRENLPPDPDFFVKVECLNGMLVFENSKSGHADGSTYEVESKFRFSKDSVGDLIVHEVYSVKSTNLGFFWKKRNGEAVTRFHPLQD